MPRVPRAEVFVPDRICICHLVQRCVRRSFLTGYDERTGTDYSFRREWIRARLERLASVFAVDVLSYSILSNHLHVVARNRPDVVSTWTDKMVAERWLRLFPGCQTDEFLGEPTQAQVEALAQDAEAIAVRRNRLSDFSWFMKSLAEPIARVSNQQDQVTGHFWQGRFKAQAITDEASLLAVSLYVDLNPIRAALAESPETASPSSAYDRIQSTNGETIPSSAVGIQILTREDASAIRKSSTPEELRRRQADAKKKRGKQILRDAWLSPMNINEQEPIGPQPSNTGVRASDKGFLQLDIQQYTDLMKMIIARDKDSEERLSQRGEHLMLGKIRVEVDTICDMVKNFKRYFGRGSAIGLTRSLCEYAERHGKKFIPGQRAVRKLSLGI